MSPSLLTCDECGWERVSQSPRFDVKVRAEHAKTHESKPSAEPIPAAAARRAASPAPVTRRSSWDDREESTWIDKM